MSGTRPTSGMHAGPGNAPGGERARRRAGPRLPWAAALVAAVATVTAAPAAAQPAPAGDLDRALPEKLAQVRECLDERIRASARDPDPERSAPFTRSRESPVYLDVAVFEAVTAMVPAGDIPALDARRFCDERLWPRYETAMRTAFERIRQDKEPDFAPPGRQSIESSSFFVQSFQNIWGKHDLGHADITARALDQLAGRVAGRDPRIAAAAQRFAARCACQPSEFARTLLARAAQSPDLYRWTDEAYHAHTPGYRPNDAGHHQAQIQRGRDATLEVLRLHAERARDAAARFDPTSALFHLGAGAHVVQDLVYHHGMTLQEHSGLHYVPGYGHPDFPPGAEDAGATGAFPPGSEAAARFEHAAALTVVYFDWILGGIEGRLQRRMFDLGRQPDGREVIPPGFSFPALARRGFGGAEDIGLLSLGSYWLEHRAYTREDRPLSELDAARAPDHPWDPDAFMQVLTGAGGGS